MFGKINSILNAIFVIVIVIVIVIVELEYEKKAKSYGGRASSFEKKAVSC